MKNLDLQRHYPIFLFIGISGIIMLALYFYTSERISGFFQEKKNREMKSEVMMLKQIIKNRELIRNREIKVAARTVSELTNFEENLSISESDSITIKTKIREAGVTELIKLPKVSYKNEEIYGNQELGRKIHRVTNTHFKFWIKTTEGFVQILKDERNTGEFISEYMHSARPEVRSVEKEIDYLSRTITQYDTHLNLYTPIFIEGNLKGIIQLSVSEGLTSYLKKLYDDQEDNNYSIFLVNSGGDALIDNEFSKLFSDKQLNDKLSKERKNYSRINHSYQSDTGLSKLEFAYTFLPNSNLYAGFIFEKRNSRLMSRRQKSVLIIIVVLVYFSFVAMFSYYILRHERNNKKLTHAMNSIVQGHLTEAKQKIPGNNAGKVLNLIVDYLNHLSNYASSIKTGKDYKQYSPEKSDIVGSALRKIKEEKERRKEKALIKKFTSEMKERTEKGKAEINDLLRYTAKIDKLSEEIIKVIYRLLEIEQIGFFIVTKEKEKYTIELEAAFAYGEERYFDKKVVDAESLIGRVVLEKQSVYLKDIPEKYSRIETGFGYAEPKSLYIIPLIFNNEVQAIIEIAGLKEIQSHQIKFLEVVGENIASTISNIRTSKQTQELLKQTEIQSKQIEEQRIELKEKISTHRRQNRRMDKDLNEKAEHINAIYGAGFFIEFTTEGVVMDINKNMLDLFGFEKNEWVGKRHSEMIVCDDYKESYAGFFRDLYKSVLKYRVEKISLRSNSVIKFSTIYTPLRNARGRIKSVLLMAQKID